MSKDIETIKAFKMALYRARLFDRKVYVDGKYYELDPYLKRIRYVYLFSQVLMFFVGILIVLFITDFKMNLLALLIMFVVYVALTLLHLYLAMRFTPDKILSHFKKIKS